MHRDAKQAVEALQRSGELVDAVIGHRDEHNARERTGEFGEFALLPVAAGARHGLREGVDESGTIVADDGEHELGHARSLAGLRQ